MPNESETSLVLQGLKAVLDDGEPAERAVAKLLRANPQLDNAGRVAVSRPVLAIACLRGRIDFLMGAHAVSTGERNARRLAAFLVTEDGLPVASVVERCGLSASAAEWLEPLARGEASWPADPVARLAAERSLPGWLAELWAKQLGVGEADALAQVTNQRGPITLRANLLRNDRDQLAARLADEGIGAVPTAWSPWGLTLTARANLNGSKAWREGRFEVQDEGSQLVALAVGAQPGERVVDFCAGAGGKTLALAAAMGNRGVLVAADVNGDRLADLRPRLVRNGVTCVGAIRLPDSGDALAGEAARADRVLVDGPCSSLGTLRRGPDARWRISVEETAGFPALQLGILEKAARLVRPGGRLVYATCTVNRHENEDVADRFEASHPDFVPAPLADGLGKGLAERLGAGSRMLLLPHRHGSDGFFISAWQRG